VPVLDNKEIRSDEPGKFGFDEAENQRVYASKNKCLLQTIKLGSGPILLVSSRCEDAPTDMKTFGKLMMPPYHSIL
jgi:hypothetical protein